MQIGSDVHYFPFLDEGVYQETRLFVSSSLSWLGLHGLGYQRKTVVCLELLTSKRPQHTGIVTPHMASTSESHISVRSFNLCFSGHLVKLLLLLLLLLFCFFTVCFFFCRPKQYNGKQKICQCPWSAKFESNGRYVERGVKWTTFSIFLFILSCCEAIIKVKNKNKKNVLSLTE